MTLDPIKFRELVEAWEAARKAETAAMSSPFEDEQDDAISFQIHSAECLARFLLSHASELLAVVEAQGWRPIDQHTPKGIWLECRRPSLTHPSGYWIAMLIYSDGHWLDTSGAAFEPHEYRLPPPETAQ